MSILVIDADTKALVRRVIEYASAPRNHYFILEGGHSYQKPPGDNPNHVAHLHSYRCVFSISHTKADGKTWRHLSVSVKEKGKFPAPIVAFTIAQMFGFTGWDGQSEKPPKDWAGVADRADNCVVLFQEYKESVASAH